MDGLKMKISVVICTFNGGNFIQPQLESILRQSMPPDEIIVCDDASTDDTIDKVHRIAAKWPTMVRIIQNETNLGCVKNFEQAIKHTTGDIIFLSDQDDFWFNEKIETMYIPFSQNNRIGLLYSDAILTDIALKPTGKTLFGCRKNLHLNNKRLAYQLVRGVGINGCTLAFRSNLKSLILPISEEWGHDQWIAFIAYAVMDYSIINKPLMFYRRHGNNAGNDPILDGGWTKKLSISFNTSGTEAYAKDRRHWEAMFKRLQEISSAYNSFFETRSRFDEYLTECERRLKFALLREAIKRKGRLKNFHLLLQALLRGYYHRYLKGMKSLFKDVLIK